MKLTEFFNKPLDVNQKKKDRDNPQFEDDLFWYILDHDKLHKDYFFPIAKKLKNLKECSPEMVLELYMPMVKKGCKEYYQDKKMKEKISRVFPREFRESLCKRIHDHYYDDIQADKYKLG